MGDYTLAEQSTRWLKCSWIVYWVTCTSNRVVELNGSFNHCSLLHSSDSPYNNSPLSNVCLLLLSPCLVYIPIFYACIYAAKHAQDILLFNRFIKTRVVVLPASQNFWGFRTRKPPKYAPEFDFAFCVKSQEFYWIFWKLIKSNKKITSLWLQTFKAWIH